VFDESGRNGAFGSPAHPAGGIDRYAFHQSGKDLDTLCRAQPVHHVTILADCRFVVNKLAILCEYIAYNFPIDRESIVDIMHLNNKS
jgi:hypothetical protein